MSNPSFFLPIVLWSFLLSFTIYSTYMRFGYPSKSLRDPFDENED